MGTQWEHQGLRLWQSDDMKSYSISDIGASSQIPLLIEECSSRVPYAKEHIEERATFIVMYNKINPAPLLLDPNKGIGEYFNRPVPTNVIYGNKEEKSNIND